MPRRLKVENSAGHKYVGFAKRKHTYLEQRRKSLGRISMQQFFKAGPVTIEIFASDFDNYIRITGASSVNHIIFASDSPVIQLTAYNYIDDKLQETAKFDNSAGDIHAYFNNVCHYNDKKTLAGRKVEDLPFLTGQPIPYHSHELEFLQTGNTLHARNPETDVLSDIAFLVNAGWLPGHSRAQGAFIFLPRYQELPIWNLNGVADFWAFAPASKAILPVFQWIPGFFFAEPGNGIYGTGWQYGKFLQSWVEPPDGYSIKSAAVTFGGMLENRVQSAIKPYGYCETLTKMDDEDKFLISFFAQSSPFGFEANPTWVQQNAGGSKLGGTSMTGKKPEFRLDLFPVLGVVNSDPAIDWWNATYEPDEGESQPSIDLQGIAVTSGGRTAIYRYNGAAILIYNSTLYHSHAKSASGRYIAIFEKAEDGTTINRVIVYDLQKNKELQDSTVVAGAAAMSGAWIPRNVENFTPTGLGYTIGAEVPAQMIDEDTFKFRAHYGTVTFSEGNNASTNNRKMLCEDGIHATVGVYVDPCFEMKLTRIEPDGAPPSGAVSVVIGGETYNASVFQELTQVLPHILFSSAGPPPVPYEIVVCHWTLNQAGDPIPEEIGVTGTNVRISTIERKAMSLTLDTYGQVDIENALGDITRNGFDEAGEVTIDTSCGPATISATTSCGQSAELEIEDSGTPVVLDYYNAYGSDLYFKESPSQTPTIHVSGGTPPYTVSTTLGAVAYYEGILAPGASRGWKVIDDGGCANIVTLTATDSCGRTDSIKLLPLSVVLERLVQDSIVGTPSGTDYDIAYWGGDDIYYEEGWRYVVLGESGCTDCSFDSSSPISDSCGTIDRLYYKGDGDNIPAPKPPFSSTCVKKYYKQRYRCCS